MQITIDKMKVEDWPAVQSIYQEGIDTGNATFETNIPDWEQWNKNHLKDCRLIARAKDQVVGWAALLPVSTRQVYAGVAEVSIYIKESARGLGIGKALLKTVIKESECAGFWTLQAGIFPENEISISLHKACGFREVGHRKRIGNMNGIWRDVVLLERRSKTVN